MSSREEQIQILVRSLQNSFEHSKSSSEKCQLLKDLSVFLLYKEDSFYASNEYRVVLNLLLDKATVSNLENKDYESWFSSYFLNGIHHESFIVLVYRLNSSSPSVQQQKILELLERFLCKDNIYSMLLYQCCGEAQRVKDIGQVPYWDSLLTSLVSLPERVANKSPRNSRKLLAAESYIPFVGCNIWKVLLNVHKDLSLEKDCNIEFLGKLIGRLCLCGHNIQIVNYLSSKFVNVCVDDFLWRRIIQNFISKIPSKSMENFLSCLLLSVPWYGYLDWILGDTILKNLTIQHLITVKFLLIRQFNDVRVLQNIMGYLATKPEMFEDVLKRLIEYWSDHGIYAQQGFPQLYYLSKAFMTSVPHLNSLKKSLDNSGIVQQILEGTQMRLSNADVRVCSIAMFVGENLISALDSEAPPLDFKHDEEMPEIKHLKSLLYAPEEPKKDLNMEDGLEFDKLYVENTVSTPSEKIESSQRSVNDDLDSDDDLEPYDIPADMSTSRKGPYYIRDCLQGLIESENPDWKEQCLRSLPNLIESATEETSEVCVELAQVLLHMNDDTGMEDFISCRHRALTTLTTTFPLEVALYLTSQFYERDYNIRQRLDILEVIAAASQQLTDPTLKVTASEEKPASTSQMLPPVETDWRVIVDKRLHAKTRIKSRMKKKEVVYHKNTFGSVAGCFFFPLIENFNKKMVYLKLMDDDSHVLTRLLYTLGIVMYSATNTLICGKMGSTLLKFLPAVQNHTDTPVRAMAIFAVTTVFLSVPSYLILSDMQSDTTSTLVWLSEIIEKDIDEDCRIKASHAVQIFQESVKEELPLMQLTEMASLCLEL